MVYDAEQRVAAVRAEIAELDRRREAIVGELGGLSGVIQALAVPEPSEHALDQPPGEPSHEHVDVHQDLDDDRDDQHDEHHEHEQHDEQAPPDAVHETVPPTPDSRPSNSED
jgi:hypothetical protein